MDRLGTNFYLKHINCEDYMDPEWHIGRRSAAGLYCWDCMMSLFNGPIDRLHWGDEEYSMHKTCPQCGKEPIDEGLDSGSAAVELGFAKPYKENEQFGVKSCSSFTWAMHKVMMEAKILLYNKTQWRFWKPYRPIVDEYEREYSMKEFTEKVLKNCPIQYYDSIGKWFG